MLLLLLLSHFSRVRLCATPSLGFSRQEHWSGLCIVINLQNLIITLPQMQTITYRMDVQQGPTV